MAGMAQYDMTKVVVLGFDPDSGSDFGGSGVVLATTRKVLAVGVATMPKKAQGKWAVAQQCQQVQKLLRRVVKIGRIDRAVLEIPMDYGEKRVARIEDIMPLSLVSGCARGVIEEFCSRVDFVEPWQWKGQRKKGPDQRNSLKYFGWDFDDRGGGTAKPKFSIPRNVLVLSEGITEKHHCEIADAMGLALYALDREGAA